jgi:gliding motility-associated lipoprotein GldH
MRKLFFLLFCGAIIAACTNSSVYNTSYQFKNNVWKQKTRPTFIVNIPDTTITYDFTLSIRTSTDYKYNNLWIYLTTKTPFKQIIRDPYEIKICFPNGEWIGHKTGSIVEHKIVFKRRKLPQIGQYTFIVEQGVIQSALNEVIDITFDVSKAEK